MMKIFVVLLLGVALAKAQECIPLRDDKFETMKCTVTEGEQVIVVEGENCTETTCCEFMGECVVADTGVMPAQQDDGVNETEAFVKAQFEQVPSAVDEANDELNATMRSLGFPPFPGIAPTCYPPVPFPANCKISRHEPYVLEPPVSVPYCLRISCRPDSKHTYDKSLKMCGSQPGCYFDKELYELRTAYPTVLPGVPVCHLAIRNKFFLQKSQAVVQKYGSWNPYFTNCLLTQFAKEIRKGPEGCELLPILDAFYITAKMAGWSTINNYSCALIGACFRKGRGCFYPVDISNVRVKSGQREIILQKNEIVYGRPKCQPFDISSPLTILKSYHRCLSCGCTVDSSITILYYNHLFSLGNKLTIENHWKYWGDVKRGHVGAFNIESVLSEYGDLIKEDTTTPRSTPPPKFPTEDPFGGDLFPLPGGIGGQGPPLVPMSNSASPQFLFQPPLQQGKPACGFAFRQYGGRPCEPPKFTITKHNKYCPYKPFHVPRFDALKGTFEGCCDLNLCYLPKSEISKMHSGPSMYYSEWSFYSACSVSCGTGEQKRYRRCVSHDIKLCTKELEDTKPCLTIRCPSWTAWSSYSPCSRSCFPGGIRTRTRQCLPKGGFCPGEGEEVKNCNEHTC